MSQPHPTIVLVPGAWHSPAAFDPILPLLHAAKYPTTTVHLPSIGVTPGLLDFSADVSAIRTTVSGLAGLGRDVVVVSHSYGGTPSTESLRGLSKFDREAEGKPGGVVQLIYISALVPQKGETALECLRNEPPPTKQERVDNGDGTSSVENSIESFYNDIDIPLAKYLTSLLRTQSSSVFASPLTYEAYQHILSAYLFCANDQAISLQTQQRIAREAGIEVTRTIQSGHSPFISVPTEVVQFIRELLETE